MSHNFKSKVVVHAHGTIANLVCGFDILGLCLDSPFDEMTIGLIDDGIKLSCSDSYTLPLNPAENVAGVALQAFIDGYNQLPEHLKQHPKIGFDVFIDKRIMPGSGLGSSAASSAGAVVAANHLLGNPFDKKTLVDFAKQGEAVASGAPHADNVAPCILGGITLVRSNDPLDVVKLDYPEMYFTIVHPQIELKTSDARKFLPTEIPLKKAIAQWSNIAGLVSGLFLKDYDLISRSLTDHIVEPLRSILIPGLQHIKEESIKLGALGGGISGSGPSVFMISKDETTAKKVEAYMQQYYTSQQIGFMTYVSRINEGGVKIVNH
jgi:homoserine kinase